mmetsp:Transcript_10649/g.44033  ORF Transcript_10649/g.44033 Transcript_10649/m.44033 type:complete len:236 (-) Transcript_10649:1816-2523(-)
MPSPPARNSSADIQRAPSSSVSHGETGGGASALPAALGSGWALSTHRKNMSSFCATCVPSARRIATTPSKCARTPVSSNTSRAAAASTSSLSSARPVTSFQPRPAAGPRRSRTTSTLSSHTTSAPTPTCELAAGGSVLTSPSGSQRDIMTKSRSAWWKAKARSAATGTSAACSRPMRSHAPRTASRFHALRLASSAAPKVAASAASAPAADTSTVTPPYASAVAGSSEPCVGAAD